MIEDWAVLATGESGSIELERAWLRKAQEIFNLFCRKQYDYGENNIALGGEKGVIQRALDKFSRLWTLTGMGGEMRKAKSGEPRRDAWVDLADYGIIGLMVHDGDWPVKSLEEVFVSNCTSG